MKIRFLILLLAFTFSFSTAQDKYAFLDLIKVMNFSKEGEKLKKEIEEKFNYYQSKAKSIEEKIKEIKKQLESPLLSEKAKEEKNKELEKLRGEIQKLTVEAQTVLNDMKKNAENKLTKKIQLAVKEYSQKNNIDIVFFNSMVSPILYADKKIDITDKIIEILNRGENEVK
jgi:outer membrane protein